MEFFTLNCQNYPSHLSTVYYSPCSSASLNINIILKDEFISIISRLKNVYFSFWKMREDKIYIIIVEEFVSFIYCQNTANTVLLYAKSYRKQESNVGK